MTKISILGVVFFLAFICSFPACIVFDSSESIIGQDCGVVASASILREMIQSALRHVNVPAKNSLEIRLSMRYIPGGCMLLKIE